MSAGFFVLCRYRHHPSSSVYRLSAIIRHHPLSSAIIRLSVIRIMTANLLKHNAVAYAAKPSNFAAKPSQTVANRHQTVAKPSPNRFRRTKMSDN
jgi:putative component of membrane protein insertase Oxa1/YidC/SpoIIIJ protein YidD